MEEQKQWEYWDEDTRAKYNSVMHQIHDRFSTLSSDWFWGKVTDDDALEEMKSMIEKLYWITVEVWDLRQSICMEMQYIRKKSGNRQQELDEIAKLVELMKEEKSNENQENL